MDEIKLDILSGDIRLLSGTGRDTFKRTFHIKKCVSGKGSSAICYEAYYGSAASLSGSGIGVLKEFYPKAFKDDLERRPDGQLILKSSDSARGAEFQQELSKYLAPYEKLLNIKQNAKNADDIATFIPHFELYRGCDEQGNPIGTAYVWTPQPLLETFADMCRDIHENPTVRPEFKLLSVLKCIESLTSCIRNLHCNMLVHRDINPNNFGFVKRDSEVLPQSTVLFDINSICQRGEIPPEIMGTPGYMDPNAQNYYNESSAAWDIYSIGACLFYAIVVCDKTKKTNYQYKPEFFSELQHLMNESELIKSSEYNSYPRLVYCLTHILKKCLWRQTDFWDDKSPLPVYRYCEELMADLKRAIHYVFPSDNPMFESNQWKLVDQEKEWDSMKDKNSQLAMQYHLFDHPLYEAGNDGDAINVTVLGFGHYGQKFTDICLQVGHIGEKTLNVSVFSNDIEGDGDEEKKSYVSDATIYLDARPALREFFDINGQYDKNRKEECYGHIFFKKAELKEQPGRGGISGLDQCIDQGSLKPQYIFIALGNDATNVAIAKACREYTNEKKIACCICFAYDGVCPIEPGMKGVYPIYVSKNREDWPRYEEIERMAFNAHLVWETNQNMSFEDIRKEYLKPYNHDSNMAYVLTLKYFLHDAGIEAPIIGEMDMGECCRIAGLVTEATKDKQVMNRLAYYENRRWNIEKLTQGWQPLNDLESCVWNGTKDKAAKLHACIRRSLPGETLSDRYRDLSQWDLLTEEQIKGLDDLDALTVRIHQTYLRAARKTKQINHLSGEVMNSLRDLAEENQVVYASFIEWYSCLTKIWNGDRSQAQQYGSLKQAFWDAASVLGETAQNMIKSRTETFESDIRPVLSAMEYRDEKAKDFLLVTYLPFILSNDPDVCMIIPYHMGEGEGFDMTHAFGNMAAATVVDPAELVFVVDLSSEQALKTAARGFAWICDYVKSKNLRAKIDVLITFPAEMKDHITEETPQRLKDVGEGRIRKVTVIYRTETLLEVLNRYKDGRRQCLLEKNGSRASQMLEAAGLYQNFSCYSFGYEGTELILTSIRNCEQLLYAQNVKKAHEHLFVRATDMPIRRRSARDGLSQPEFYHDHELLWQKYRDAQSEWAYMAELLAEYRRKNDVVATFSIPKDKEAERDSGRLCVYKVPTDCVMTVKALLKKLSDFGVISSRSHIKPDTIRSYEVRIYDLTDNRETLDDLMAVIFGMLPGQTLEIVKDSSSDLVTVTYDRPDVIDLEVEEDRLEQVYSLLGFFRDQGYILRLKQKDGKLSFIFATSQIKALMSEKSKIFEIYTYHKIKSSGLFDDVIAGWEIDWKKMGCKKSPGFSYVITKGFSTLFVGFESLCGGTAAYHDHSMLLKRNGIRAQAVYISESLEQDAETLADVNEQRSKRFQNVVVLQGSSEISDIGNALRKIMEGTY